MKPGSWPIAKVEVAEHIPRTDWTPVGCVILTDTEGKSEGAMLWFQIKESVFKRLQNQ